MTTKILTRLFKVFGAEDNTAIDFVVDCLALYFIVAVVWSWVK